MNKYYCTGEVLENGYLKVVVPEMDEPNQYDFYEPDYEEPGRTYYDSDSYIRKTKEWNSHLASLPLATLVVGGKTGWLEGYEERYEVQEYLLRSIASKEWININKGAYDIIQKTYPTDCRIVLVKKPEEKSEGNYAAMVTSKPVINERFADNGEHSHWELIDSTNGKILWTEGEDAAPVVEDRPKWVNTDRGADANKHSERESLDKKHGDA